jgi:hypothetical protein
MGANENPGRFMRTRPKEPRYQEAAKDQDPDLHFDRPF